MMTRSTQLGAATAGEADTANQKVLQIARTAAATIGADFFVVIAKHLAKAIGADCVFIGEFVGGRMESVRTLGAYLDGHPLNFEYELAGSASASILLGRSVLIRKDAFSRFPSDKLLEMARADALVGEPLVDLDGHPIGVIMALYRHPVASFAIAKRILQIFSARASGELNRKREEDDLRASEQRYRVFIARNADAMWRIEFERPISTSLSPKDQLAAIYRYGYVAECNDALAAMLGLSKAEQVIGFRLEDVAPQSDPRILAATLIAIQRGYDLTTIETKRIDKSGKTQYLLRSHWGIVEDGKLERLWGTTRDISELKQSQHELDASEQRMANLLDTMKLVVIIEDANGAVSYCNKYFYRKTGWRAVDVAGKPWLDGIVPVDEHTKIRGLLESARHRPETPVHFECGLVGPEGQRWRFEWDRTGLRDADGQISSWANLGRDVTEHKALEARFHQAQKLATIGELAGGVAHDFNNLLTVILGYSFRLMERKDTADPEFTPLDEIRKAATKGAELTHRLLAFGRRQTLHPEVLALDGVIKDAEHMLRRLIGDDVQLATELEGSAGQVLVDAGSFHQVLMNLAVNARDAMPHGGTLKIATANATVLRPEDPSGVAPGEYVVVTVSDTGTGMSADVKEHLFEPFFTTKSPGRGTGLGLATVYGIVQQSSGAIVVDTEQGRGTAFRIYFPRVKTTSTKKQVGVAHKKMPRGTETILLVEDREDVRELAGRTLRDLGYTVLEADGPERALQLAQNRDQAIQLLLSDVMMPGMKGFELASLVQSYKTGIKVLLISGYTAPAEGSDEPDVNGYAYLQKPFTPLTLASAVRQILDGD